jgi:hypothetical protein
VEPWHEVVASLEVDARRGTFLRPVPTPGSATVVWTDPAAPQPIAEFEDVVAGGDRDVVTDERLRDQSGIERDGLAYRSFEQWPRLLDHAGQQPAGRREVNWDGAGARPFNNQDHFPLDFFNNNVKAGLVYAKKCSSTWKISAAASESAIGS